MSNGSQGGFRMDDRLPPWAIQPGESMEAYYKFTRYRDMGFKRSQEATATALCEDAREEDWNTLPPDERERLVAIEQRVVSRMSSKYRWVDRCRAYDAMMDAERVRARVAAERDKVAEAVERHQQLAQGTLQLAAKWLRKMLTEDNFAVPRLADMTIGEFLNLQRQGVMGERLALNIDDRERSEKEAAILAGPAGAPAASSPADLREIARKAALDAIAGEPKPVKAAMPPEDDDDGGHVRTVRDAGADQPGVVPAAGGAGAVDGGGVRPGGDGDAGG